MNDHSESSKRFPKAGKEKSKCYFSKLTQERRVMITVDHLKFNRVEKGFHTCVVIRHTGSCWERYGSGWHIIGGPDPNSRTQRAFTGIGVDSAVGSAADDIAICSNKPYSIMLSHLILMRSLYTLFVAL